MADIYIVRQAEQHAKSHLRSLHNWQFGIFVMSYFVEVMRAADYAQLAAAVRVVRTPDAFAAVVVV
jgi:hypothetical protein